MKKYRQIIIAKSFIWLLFVAVIAMGISSCKSKKKIAEQQAEQEQARKIAQVKADLEGLLASPDAQNFEELEVKENKFVVIKSFSGVNENKDIAELMSAVDRKLVRERDALERKKKTQEEEEARKQQQLEIQQQQEQKEKQVSPEKTQAKATLENLFREISSSSKYDGVNQKIDQALQMFASDNVPVLVIISEYGNGKKDYDRPTTIRKYLEYLKDQKKNQNTIENIVTNNANKIVELELRKK